MVFYAAFNSISVISRRQLTLFMLSWVSPVLGWALQCLAQGHSHEKTQRIQCGSNPGPLDYESNTLPLSHAGLSAMFIPKISLPPPGFSSLNVLIIHAFSSHIIVYQLFWNFNFLHWLPRQMVHKHFQGFDCIILSTWLPVKLFTRFYGCHHPLNIFQTFISKQIIHVEYP